MNIENIGNETQNVKPFQTGKQHNNPIKTKLIDDRDRHNLAFLRGVLPDTGYYAAIALGNGSPRCYMVSTHKELYQQLRKFSEKGCDAYFTVASLKDKSGRKQDNVDKLKCFRLDIDCKAGSEGYDNEEQAAEAVDKFIVSVGLPHPWIVLSGTGLHGYWPLVEPVDPVTWRRYATGLKTACTKHGLKADPVVTSDVARILRAPGTINYKDPANPKPVVLDKYSLGLGPYPLSAFDGLLMTSTETSTEANKAESKAPSDVLASAPTVCNEGTIRYYAGALNSIPVADDRERWLQVGMALHALGWGDRGYDLWDSWSQRSTNYDQTDQLKTWKSFDRKRGDDAPSISAGTLIRLAEQAGWRSEVAAIQSGLDPHDKTPGKPVNNVIIEINEKYFKMNNLGGQGVVGWFDQGKLAFQKDVEWSKRFNNKNVLNEAGKLVELGSYWLKHTDRRGYESVVLDPEGTEVLPDNKLNLWRGFGVEPIKGDWSLTKRHIFEVLADYDKPAEEYILNYSAWIIQNPGKLPGVALIFRGGEGTGKGVFVQNLLRIFGVHSLQISNREHLTGRFNGHLYDCLMLFADEAYYPGDKAAEGVLKAWVSEETIMIEDKGFRAVAATNRLKIIMASNNEWVIPAGHDSRRYAVFDVSNKYSNVNSSQDEREAYFGALVNEMKNGGTAAMLYDLRQRKLDGWHPCRIINNEALANQRQLSMDPLTGWLGEMIEDGMLPGGYDKTIPDEAVRSNVLMEAAKNYDSYLNRSLNAKKLSMFFKKNGLSTCRSQEADRARCWQFPPLCDLRASWTKCHGTVFDNKTEWSQNGKPKPETQPHLRLVTTQNSEDQGRPF